MKTGAVYKREVLCRGPSFFVRPCPDAAGAGLSLLADGVAVLQGVFFRTVLPGPSG